MIISCCCNSWSGATGLQSHLKINSHNGIVLLNVPIVWFQIKKWLQFSNQCFDDPPECWKLFPYSGKISQWIEIPNSLLGSGQRLQMDRWIKEKLRKEGGSEVHYQALLNSLFWNDKWNTRDERRDQSCSARRVWIRCAINYYTWQDYLQKVDVIFCTSECELKRINYSTLFQN